MLEKDQPGPGVQRRATDGLNVSSVAAGATEAPPKTKGEQAKKVENTLLDFEKRQPSNVEFFKV